MMDTVKKKSGSLGANKTTAKSVNHDERLHKYSTTFKNILQVILAILAVSLLLGLMVTVIKGICDVPEYVPIEHHVRRGETLWSIAKQYKPDDITMDEYMAWVYEQNGHGGNIYPGDVVIMAEVVR
jgi:nucleoid-associated protein YgaU